MDSSALANATSWLAVLWYVKLAAAGFVALGVGLEFGADWISRPFEKIVEHAREEQLSSLRTETTRLSAEAQEAQARIADANARAEEAKLALEKFRAPRNLTSEQQQNVIDGIKGFAGQQYCALLSAGADTQSFWTLLNAVLRRAGWRRVSSGGLEVGNPPAGVGINLLPGVYVGYAAEEDEGRTAAAAKLAAALNLAGISAAAGVDTVATQDQRTIRIAIGVKPQ